MPTPSSDQTVDERSLHSSCPPEDNRSSSWRTSEIDEMRREDSTSVPIGNQQHSIPLSDSHRSPDLSDVNPNEQRMKQMGAAEESQTSSSEIMSPVSAEDTQEDSEQSENHVLSSGYPGGSSSMSNEFSNVRVCVLPLRTPLKLMLIWILCSWFHLHRPPFYAREASSMAHNNLSGKSMTYKLR